MESKSWYENRINQLEEVNIKRCDQVKDLLEACKSMLAWLKYIQKQHPKSLDPKFDFEKWEPAQAIAKAEGKDLV